ncbi:elongation factor P [Trichlorobacter lovleyi]|jgi:translation initiation factor 5A (eIF-5A)|uniref:Elongation factor P n=1 Tax=Trichlorobacter lovleyi (strain ATCC BAA-1151 / DSM 17278 / SZ) TaxID=398767 RepID=B3E3Z6_TRIL1|nr:elongation factor P [Trichlorobacter lovleyi]ACD94410.1 translation elongation factor P [Trichlorobacter lovleyi SZ]
MYTTSDFKKGLVIQLEGAPCLLLDVTIQSPSARGANTMVKTRYRNLLTGQVLDRTFRSGDKVEEADYERHKGQFLYADGECGVFMDLETYEQFEMDEEAFSAISLFLLEGTEVTLGLFQGRMVMAEPPMVVELTVTDTAPIIKHATATAETKDAILETGLKLKVPPYLENGVKIKVDTRDGRFLSRA